MSISCGKDQDMTTGSLLQEIFLRLFSAFDADVGKWDSKLAIVFLITLKIIFPERDD